MSNRFVSANAEALVDYLKTSRLDPEAKAVEPDTHLHGGCSDPDHCLQHPGHLNGVPMLSVVTKLSNKQLHLLAVQLGLPIKA
jgi:hypothetical protein